jgi:hypothetical protein
MVASDHSGLSMPLATIWSALAELNAQGVS